MTTPTEHRLARNITIRRGPGMRVFTVEIDGEPFPYLLDPEAKATVDVDKAPSVTLTMLAETVTVDDQMLAGQGAQFNHEHDDEPTP